MDTNDFGKRAIDVLEVSALPDTLQWLVVKFAPSPDSTDKKLIENQRKYKIALQLQSKSTPQKSGKAEIDIDTGTTLSIVAPL